VTTKRIANKTALILWIAETATTPCTFIITTPEINESLGEWIAISREEYEAYIQETIQTIVDRFSEIL
jgi:hypothetical protein